MEANGRDARSLASPPAPSPSSSSSCSQTPYNVPNAALTGALTAFSKPAPKQQQHALTKTHTGSNGAFSTAKSVNRNGTSSDPPASALTYNNLAHEDNLRSILDKQNTGGSNKQRLTPDRNSAASRSTTPVHLYRPAVSRSSSFTAATIAAARHQKATPISTPSQRTPTHEAAGFDYRAHALQLRLNERMVARALENNMDNERERGDADEKTDLASIEPTKSLVKMFEQQSAEAATTKPVLPRQLSTAKGKPPPIVAPKPQRNVSMQSVSPELQRPDVLPKPKKTTITTKMPNVGIVAPPESSSATKDRDSKPNVPPPRRTTQHTKISGHVTATESAPPLTRIPPAISPKPASRTPSVPPPSQVLSSNPRRASPAHYKDTSLNMLSPHMTGDSLADAMVGANLAIKSTSPPKRSRTPPPLPSPRRKNPHSHDIFHHRSRSLSPQKKQPGRLLTTLRPDEVDEKQKNKKHHFRQPNKHHEGTRERWRDFVSDHERKRYEGVWAANKGLYISSAAQADEVLNLVARDIWARSRLPSDRLAKVWDLVTEEEGRGRDAPERRTLTREQFVVGMWFIDQTLKGRNLPHSVNASVWSSVRLMGVKVRLEGKGKDGRKLERGADW